MIRLRRAACVFTMLSLVPAPALAADILIPGTTTVVKPGKLAKVIAKRGDVDFSIPAPGSAEDPTIGGVEMRYFDTVAPGGSAVSFRLDASGWSGLGTPLGSKGYKYKGRDDQLDPEPKGTCKSVLLTSKTIKATCKGNPVVLTTPFSGSGAIELALPADSSTSRYCAEFGGDLKKNDAKLFKRVKAPAPLGCAEISLSGLDVDDVVQLADDSYTGRDNATPGSVLAQDYLIDELEVIANGLNSAQSGDDAFKQQFTSGTNILALIPGDELPGEYVLIGAHYDHVGSGCILLEAGDTICNGATDNAAGVAAVLAAGRTIAALPDAPRRSVILALWDREEDGLLGSQYYVQNPLVPLADTIAYINFDILGSNLLPSLKTFSFAISGETGGAELLGLVDAAVAGINLGTRKLSFIFGQARSDYLNFVNAGVPSVFFGDATGPCYHTNQDEVSVVDFDKLSKQSLIGYNLATALIDTTTPPTFVSPSSALATFDDAVVLNDAINAATADLGMLSAPDQATVLARQAELNAIVADGAGSFDSADVLVLLGSALDLLAILATIPCDGFL